MASRTRKPSKKKKVRARASSPSVAALREATSRWSDASDALCAAAEEEVSEPILLQKKKASADDLSEEFFSQPVSFQRTIAVGHIDAFADLEPPAEVQWLTPALKARRRKLRSMVTAVVGLAAVVLTIGIAKHALRDRVVDTTSLTASTDAIAAPARTIGRPAKRPTAATHVEQRQRPR